MTHIEKINDLKISQNLEIINSLFDELSNHENFPGFITSCQRINTVSDFLTQILKGKTLEFVPLQTATAINNNLNQIVSNFTNYKTSKNNSCLENANNSLDQILMLLPQLLFPYSGIEAKFFKAGIDSFIKKADEFDSYIAAKTEKYNADVDEVNKNISNTKQEVEKVAKTVEQQKVRLDAAIQTTQDSFINEQKARNKEFSETLSKFKEDDEKLNKEIKERAENLRKDNETRIAEIFADMENKKKQAADLVGIISNIAVTGNFNKYAKQQKFNADVLRILAGICFCGIVTGSILIIKNISNQNFDWQVTLMRMITTAILSLPATYFARESSKHRSLEIRYRKMELELASLDPFMENLSDQKEKDALKQEIIKRMFGREEEQKIVKKGNNYNGSNLIGFLEPLVQPLVRFLEKK